MMHSGKTIDGKHFGETFSTSVKGSLLRRYFIDGKPVSLLTWLSTMNAAIEAENSRLHCAE